MLSSKTAYKAGRLEGHGNDYQRLLAWMLLQRLMLNDREFKLAFEMEDAGKFDDIGLFVNDGWNLVQTKHMQATKAENEKKMTRETLFDKKDNAFALLKYYKSYKSIKEKRTYGELNKVILFTNREFDETSFESNSFREIELDPLFNYSRGRHIQLVNHEEGLIKLLKEAEIDRELIREFFAKLVLSVEQPSVEGLRQEMINEGRRWIQSWIRPDDLGRMSESFYQIPLNTIKKHFDEYEKPRLKRKSENIPENMKDFMQKEDNRSKKQEIEELIKSEVQKCSKRSCASLEAMSRYYINRTIHFSHDKNVHFSDNEFVNQLCMANFGQNCYIFTAQPGMGKSTLLQHLAFEAQRTYPEKVVFLIYLNNFQEQIPVVNSLQDLLDTKIFQSELSTENVRLIIENVEKQILLFFDAFDELSVVNQDRIVQLTNVLLAKTNVKIVLSGRLHVKANLIRSLNATFLEMTPFDKQDQLRFFEKFWQVKQAENGKLEEFANIVLAKIHTDLSEQEQHLVGVPLMTRMLAGIFAEPFEQFITSNENLSKILPENKFSAVDLFEKFAQNSFQILINKKINKDNSLEVDSSFSETLNDLDHKYQLFAVENVREFIGLKAFLYRKDDHEKLYSFMDNYQNLQTLLFESTGNMPRFTHKLFLEYFAAKRLYQAFGDMNKCFCKPEIFYVLSKNPSILDLLLVMMNSELRACCEDGKTCRNILPTSLQNRLQVCKDLAIVNACQKDYLNLVKHLHDMHSPFSFEKMRDEAGRTLLQVTLENRSHKVDAFLVKIFTDEITCKYPLHNAIRSNRLDVVKLVLNKTKNINLVDDEGNTPLMLAKSTEILTVLVEKGAEFENTDNKEQSFMHKMVTNGDCELMKAFLDLKDSKEISNFIDRGDSLGNSPLHLACKSGNTEMVRILIQNAHANLNLRNNRGETPLDLAISSKYIEVVRYLVIECNAEKSENFSSAGIFHYLLTLKEEESARKTVDACLALGMDLYSKDCFGNTILHYFAESNYLEMFNFLYTKGFDVDRAINIQNCDEWTALHDALSRRSHDVAEFLINGTVDVSLTTVDGDTALHFAALWGNDKCVEKLIEKHVQLNRSLDGENISGKTALSNAADEGNERSVRLLLNANASAAKVDLKSLVLKCHNPPTLSLLQGKNKPTYKSIFECILDKVEVNSNNVDYLLFEAIWLGCENQAKRLLDVASNVNSNHRFGLTALHVAVISANLGMVNLLITKKANVNGRDEKGRTPLHFCRNVDIFRALVDAGADTNLKECNDNTMLHFAVMLGSSEMVELLINKNPLEVNGKNQFGKTALHIAMASDHGAIVDLLLNNNADLNAVDIKGKSPVFFALEELTNDFFNINYSKMEHSLFMAKKLYLIRNKCVAKFLKATNTNQIHDYQGRSPLHTAATRKDHYLVEILVRQGFDVDAIDMDGNTPLHYACGEQMYSSYEPGECLTFANNICYHLVDYSSNLDLKNKNQDTPLHISIKSNYGQLMSRLLISKGASIYLADKNENTPLHLAVLHKENQTASILIDLLEGPALNARNDKENTALHLAALKNQFDVVRKLREKGAKLHLKNDENKTASDLAKEARHRGIYEFLKSSAGETISDEGDDFWSSQPVSKPERCQRLRSTDQMLNEQRNRWVTSGGGCVVWKLYCTMYAKWYSNLSNRTIAITIVVCICMLYVSYTFNTCLISSINKTWKKAHTSFTTMTTPTEETEAPQIKILGSIVRIVPLTDDGSGSFEASRNFPNASDGSPKYRFLRQQGLRPSRHLPDALIIGVKKSGTRALLEFIRLHPDVRAAGCEVHFFDRHYAKGLHWYRHHMPPTIEGQITMEKTPSYFITREAPKRVYHMNPSTKLLVVVRDPVTRAISDYTQARSKKKDMKRFEELAFLNGTSGGVVDTNWGPVKIGVYAKHLERWLEYFPLSQLIFVSGERLIADPAVEIGRVQDFLGLKRVVNEKHFYFNSTKGFPCLLKSEERSSPHCLGKTKGRNHPKIESQAIERLREFYRPFNLKFYQLTGINFGWP